MRTTFAIKALLTFFLLGLINLSCDKTDLGAPIEIDDNGIVKSDSSEIESENEVEQETENEGEETSTADGSFADQCNLIAYPDSLYFFDEDQDLRIEPLQEYEGEYGAIPEGLEIDHNTGEIRINKSESGLRYKVYFVPEDTRDTCFTYLTVSGVDYMSNIYILNEDDSLAVPIYNGSQLIEVPEDDDHEFDDGPDDDDNDGELDEPPSGSEVIPQGVAINKKSGKIRLDRTVNNGVFGATPLNGSLQKFRIYYRLNDSSRKSLNKIDVQFHYYETLDDVPADLRKQVEDLQEYYSNFRTTGRNLKVMRLLAKPRPPDIIIVGRRRR
ncbi:hypothetical protein [Jiulongibacter sediminis]|uniref:hypothetical protein n=1 Tax=Jiulongibacter sediminis TaxID=1605367 RepID=UPI00103D652C|nr:hypothetical protein [Jiulongibacter sediminis]